MADPRAYETIEDPELEAWLSGDADDVREVIVEARVPPRTVHVGAGRSGAWLPREVDSSLTQERSAILDKLHAELASLVQGPANLLRAAGAVAVRANREQLRRIAAHPLVKAVRPNRKLR